MGGRDVLLYRDEAEGPDTVVGEARSSFFGIFTGQVALPAQQVPGRGYYAQVAQEKKGGNNEKLNCLAGTSTTIVVQSPQFRDGY